MVEKREGGSGYHSPLLWPVSLSSASLAYACERRPSIDNAFTLLDSGKARLTHHSIEDPPPDELGRADDDFLTFLTRRFFFFFLSGCAPAGATATAAATTG